MNTDEELKEYNKNDQVVIVGDSSNQNKGYYKGYYATIITHNKYDNTYMVNIDTSCVKFKVRHICLRPRPLVYYDR
jgi:ribosomal protein L21E